MRHWITLLETIALPPNLDVILRRAATDFIADWQQIDQAEEPREPSPRRELMAAVRQQGLDADSDNTITVLVPLMRREIVRLWQSFKWQNGKLSVRRNIRVPEGWERDPSRRPLGVFWATNDAYANNLTMGGDDTFTTIVSEVRPEQVDWRIVIIKHLTYSENEIRIKNGEMVPILRVYVWENSHPIEKDVSHLAGRLFSVGSRGDDWPD